MWHLWIACNDLVFNDKVLSPVDVICRAQRAFGEFVTTPKKSPATLQSPTMQSCNRWSYPPPRALKLNADAAVDPFSHKDGIGVVIRNARGSPVLAFSDPKSFSEVLVGEAIAIRTGLQAALQAGHSNILVESDNSALLSLLNNPSLHHPLAVTNVIQDIRVLASQVNVMELVFVGSALAFVLFLFAFTLLAARCDWERVIGVGKKLGYTTERKEEKCDWVKKEDNGIVDRGVRSCTFIVYGTSESGEWGRRDGIGGVAVWKVESGA
ncbi:uncharacterized protein LOC122638802 [Telopea speciosissima]|uniref:uncharacterized protein LOC122638802 n=1 Tax=Telopea speciosissima TaxID=54955 RepID=UPI001CC452BE|nr:uncharacterized protein LOC122638802 [Telopea speciosissima]